MNFKNSLPSWFGLGLILSAIRTSFQLIFPSLEIPFLDVIFSGLLGGFLYTYFMNGRLLTHRFATKASLLAILAAILPVLFLSIFSIQARLAVIAFLAEFIAFGAWHALNYATQIITAILTTFALWDVFVLLGNKLAIRALKK
ncbi:hypothetical protein BH09DEP1_BH09DEP1_5580 [soil metagenome]